VTTGAQDRSTKRNGARARFESLTEASRKPRARGARRQPPPPSPSPSPAASRHVTNQPRRRHDDACRHRRRFPNHHHTFFSSFSGAETISYRSPPLPKHSRSPSFSCLGCLVLSLLNHHLLVSLSACVRSCVCVSPSAPPLSIWQQPEPRTHALARAGLPPRPPAPLISGRPSV
jgi:hypothetical protein